MSSTVVKLDISTVWIILLPLNQFLVIFPVTSNQLAQVIFPMFACPGFNIMLDKSGIYWSQKQIHSASVLL